MDSKTTFSRPTNSLNLLDRRLRFIQFTSCDIRELRADAEVALTPGELRSHASRLCRFGEVTEVEATALKKIVDDLTSP